MAKKILIIGNGASGIVVASKIRELDKNCEIKIFSQEAVPAYHRPRLIDYLAGSASFQEILMKKDEFYTTNNIDVVNGSVIKEINPATKELSDDKGAIFGYDSLVLALGAHSFIPTIENVDLNGVFALRTVGDADAIIAEIGDQGGKQVLVLGGGLLGLETANSLMQRGCDVSVVEMFDYLLPRQLNPDAAQILQKILEGKGLKFYLGTSAKTLIGDSSVEKVQLASDQEIRADLVIVSAGVRANILLASDAGANVDRGIVVNDFMKTSLENVYAVGDCCQHNSIVYGQIAPAWEQAKIVADNICGHKSEYKGTRSEARLKVTGIPLFSVGDISKEVGEVLILKEEDKYLKVCIHKGKIISCIALGDSSHISLVSAVLAGRKSVKDLDSFFRLSRELG